MKQTTWQNCYNDSWKGRISDGSFAHPAKAAPGLIKRIFDHAFENGYLEKGSVVVVNADLLENLASDVDNGRYRRIE